MGWTYLTVLAIGLGIGAVGGWWWSQVQPDKDKKIQEREPDHPIDHPAELPLATQLRQTQAAYHMAVEMEKFKSGFLARSSHELRSPINSVISMHQLILADLCEDPAEEREFIAQAQGAAEKMLGLLDRLISLSKVAYGSEQLQIQPLNLKDVLAEVQHFTQLQAQNRSLRLEFEPPEPYVYVLADSRWLRQLLMTLIDMPITLMQEGYIRLKTSTDADLQRVHIWVDDQRPVEFWSEPVELLKTLKDEASQLAEKQDIEQQIQSRLNAASSSSLNLLIIQTLLELMGGHLTVVEVPLTSAKLSENGLEHLPLTRIQCSLPLAAAEGQGLNERPSIFA